MRKLIPLVLTVLVVGATLHWNSDPSPAGPGGSAVAAGASCHASYAGACLHPDSPDYDCAGGNGDGPDFTGPVQVIGADPYRLDGDGDGAACER